MPTPPRNEPEIAKISEDLRAWLASPSGAKQMHCAAEDAAKARAELEKRLRVPSDVMRVRVTI